MVCKETGVTLGQRNGPERTILAGFWVDKADTSAKVKPNATAHCQGDPLRVKVNSWVFAGVDQLRFFFLILAALSSLLLTGLDATAAAKKKPAIASPPKPIYLAPMRVVIVRNSDPKCEPECPQWIAAEGEIMTSTPGAFRKVFQQMGKAKLPIIIRSPGGSIEAALEIGRMIRERDLTVAVGQTEFRGCSPLDKTCKLPKASKGIYDGTISETYAFCNSACPMLLAGGTTRMISFLASAGVHQPSTTWTREYVRYREYYKIIKGKKKITSRKILGRKNVYEKTTYGLNTRLRKKLSAYYKSMGIDLAIIEETEKAKFNDMNYLSADKVDKLKLRTVPLRAIYLAAPSQCGTLSTSAVCVLDKARDPTLALRLLRKEAGITSETPEMTFRLAHLQGSDCQVSCPAWIAAEGVITSKTPEAFRDFVKATAAKNLTVVLHSEGGDLRAAIALGQDIRTGSFDTSIGRSVFVSSIEETAPAGAVPQAAQFKPDGLCQGACIAALAGGLNRHVSNSAQIRMHNPETYKNLAGSSAAIVEMNLHLRKMQLAPAFMDSLYDIKPGKQKQLQLSAVLKFAIATDARDFGDLYKPDSCKAANQTVNCYSPGFKTATAKFDAADETVVTPLLDGRFNRMTFQHFRNNDPSCEPKCPSWIFAQGRIEKGSLQDFKSSTSGHSLFNAMLVLDSPGGNETEAIAMGKFIRESAMHTTVGITAAEPCPANQQSCAVRRARVSEEQKGVCDGECVMLFVAGAERILSDQVVLMTKGYSDTDGGRLFVLEYYFRDMFASDYLVTAFKDKTYWNNHPLLSGEAKSQNVATRIVPSIAAIFEPRTCKSSVNAIYCN